MTNANQTYRRRGNCSVCRFRQNQRKDGMISDHFIYTGGENRHRCEGSGLPDLFAAENALARDRARGNKPT